MKPLPPAVQNYYVLAYYGTGSYIPKEYSAPFYTTWAEAISVLENARQSEHEEAQKEKRAERAVDIYQRLHYAYGSAKRSSG